MHWYNWIGVGLLAWMTFLVAIVGAPNWKGWLTVLGAALLTGLHLS